MGLLCNINGKKGGKPGDATGHAIGIPFGHRDGQDGESCESTEVVNLPFYNQSICCIRNSTFKNKTLELGKGGTKACLVGNAYASDGGGGGASVCSGIIEELNDDTEVAKPLFGYGQLL